jgi:hypothetical protein
LKRDIRSKEIRQIVVIETGKGQGQVAAAVAAKIFFQVSESIIQQRSSVLGHLLSSFRLSAIT